MSPSETARHALYAHYEEVLGDEHAEKLMDLLPPEDVSQLATKTDVAAVKTDVAAVKTDVGVLKTDVAELKTDVAELKTDVAELKRDVAELKTDVGEIKRDVVRVQDDIKDLTKRFDRFDERLHTMYQSFLKTIVYSMVGLTAMYGFIMTALWAQS